MGTSAYNTALPKALNVFITKVWSKLPPVGLTSYWKNIIDTDPNLNDVYMTLDLIFGGNKRIFVSSVPISTTDSSGVVYNYLPILQEEPSISSEYSMGTADPSQRSFSMSIDGRLISPSSIINSGNALAGIAELSLQKLDGEYDNRFVLMRADMSGGVDYGADDETITFDLIDPAQTSDAIIPSVICDKEKVPTVPDSFVGHRYPLVFDFYEFVPCIRSSEYNYGPTFIACAGHDHIVTAVYVNGFYRDSNNTDRGWYYGHGYDKKGNPITLIQFVQTTVKWESGDSVYATLERKDGKKRNLLDIAKAILIQGSMLTEAGLDAELFARAQIKMNPVSARCLINGSGESDTAKCMDYIQSTLSSSFPMISWTFTGRGYGPILTDRREDLIVLELVARQGLLYDRESEISESPKSEVKNSFTLKYGYDPVKDNYTKIAIRDSENSPLCKISRERYGKYDGDVMESIVIYDDKVANYVVDWLVSHYTLPSYYVEYSGSPSLMFLLRLGDNIKLTDPKVSLDQSKGTITKIEYEKGRVIIGVKLWRLYENIGDSISSGSASYTPIEKIEYPEEQDNLPEEPVDFSFNVPIWIRPDTRRTSED